MLTHLFFPVRNWSGAWPTFNARRLTFSKGQGPGAQGVHHWLVEATIPRVAYKRAGFLQQSRLFYNRAGFFTTEQALLQQSRLFYNRAGSFTKEQAFLKIYWFT